MTPLVVTTRREEPDARREAEQRREAHRSARAAKSPALITPMRMPRRRAILETIPRLRLPMPGRAKVLAMN